MMAHFKKIGMEIAFSHHAIFARGLGIASEQRCCVAVSHL